MYWKAKKGSKKQPPNKKEIRNKEGLGQVRWPFGPPQLTLKPSNNKKQKKKKQKKTSKIPKKSFSIISQIFLCWWVSKFSLFLTNWPKKRAPKKHYKNRGFGKAFLKNRYASRNGHFCIFGPKNPKPEIPVYYFFCLFLFQQQKPQKLAETPIL